MQVMISSNNFASVFVSPKLPANSYSCQHGGTNTSVKDKAIISKHSLFLALSPPKPPHPWAAVSIFLQLAGGDKKIFFSPKNISHVIEQTKAHLNPRTPQPALWHSQGGE